MQHAEILHRCFRCGYCKLPGDYLDLNCPAYLEYRFETFSPGGRMWLLRAWLEGDIETSERLQRILFSCATCGNCTEHCAFPKFKDLLLEAFTAGKAALVEAGTVPPAVRDYLTVVYEHGNPYKLPPRKRTLWAEGLDLPLYAGQEHLLWVGDVGGGDPRGRRMAAQVAALLRRAGVDFGILGPEEISDGNDVAALGETELFAHLAEGNIARLQQRGVKNIVTVSPHGFYALSRRYPELGGRFTVTHYTQVLARAMGLLAPAADRPPMTVTFHDPCYLDRHGGEHWAPRRIVAALPGVSLKEMPRTGKNALCCGGGGGNFFTHLLGEGADAPARVRVREAAETGADVLLTACPICLNMLEAAAVSENLDGRLRVCDVAELVAERLAE
jgi:Fe-S oxidoreductase